ncbi:autotransporter outer membrane beta-barrel domain-containing protein [Brucella sp. LJL56]
MATISDATITTSGVASIGVYSDGSSLVQPDPTYRYAANLTDTTITTSGQDSFGLYALSYGTITQNGGSITTSGDGAHGAVVYTNGSPIGPYDNNTTLSLTDVTIKTTGANADGVHVGEGQTTLDGVKINSSNNAVYYDGKDPNSFLTIKGDTILTSSGADRGLDIATLAIVGGTNASVDDGVQIIGSGSPNGQTHSILVDGGSLSIGNASVKFTLLDGDIPSGAILAQNRGTVTATGTHISETGDGAAAVWAIGGGQIALQGAIVSASGNGAIGLQTSDPDSIITTDKDTTLQVTGDGSQGIVAYISNNRTYHSGDANDALPGTIIIQGKDAAAFYAGDSGSVLTFDGIDLATSTTITLSDDAWTAQADSGGTVNFSGATDFSNTRLWATGGNLVFTGNSRADDPLIKIDSGALDISGVTSGADFMIGTLEGAGGTVKLGGNTLNISGSTTATYGGAITGAGGLTISGSGTTTLTGTNSYSGMTTISAGTLQIGDGQTTGTQFSGGGNIVNNSHLVVDLASADTMELGNIISGSGDFAVNSGTLTLSGANSYTGGTAVRNASTLIVGRDNNLGSAASDLTLTGASTLQINGNDSFSSTRSLHLETGEEVLNVSGAASWNGLIDGQGTLVKSGNGRLLLTADNTYAGATRIAAGTLALGGAAGKVSGGIQVDQGAILEFARTTTSSFDNVISGDGGVLKTGSGTVTLSGSNTYKGDTEIDGGILSISSDRNLGNNVAGNGTIGALIFDGGALQLGASFDSARQVKLKSSATIDTHGFDSTFSGLFSGSGKLTKTGAGTLTLAGINTYTGGMEITEGVLSISADTNLGATAGGLIFNGGTLQLTDNLTSARAVTLTSDGEIDTAQGKTGTFGGGISGAGGLTASGQGTLVLTGALAYSGATIIDTGSTLQLGDGTKDATLGQQQANITNNGTAVFNNQGSTVVDGVISGTGSLTQRGAGTLILAGQNTYTGITTINTGSTLQLGDGTKDGAINGDLANNGTIDFKNIAAYQFEGQISGTGTLNQNGNGILTLTDDSGSFAGTTNVVSGTLDIDTGATLGGIVGVKSGATLQGGGRISGNTTIENGGVLAGTSTAGLIFGGNLTMQAGSAINVSFNQSDDASSVFTVNGDVDLNAKINIDSFGTGGPGVYHLFRYDGASTGTLTIGNVPTGDDSSKVHVHTQINHEIYIENENGATLSYWNGNPVNPIGDGTVHGGDGIWSADVNALNWTDSPNYDFNGEWSAGQMAIFTGTAGTVTVDDTQGAVTASGLQFMTDGYRIQGQTNATGLTLVAPNGGSVPSIKVGAGNANDSTLTATVSAILTGSDGMQKGMGGTLVLTADNTYAGGTYIAGGTLQLGNGTMNGSLIGDITTNGKNAPTSKGTLAINAAGNYALSNKVDGAGGVSVLAGDGNGVVTISGDNSYAGDTAITSTTVAVMQNSNLGASSSNIAMNSATLRFGADFNNAGSFDHAIVLSGANGGTFDTSGHAIVMSGAISGTSVNNYSLTATGGGTLTVTANNTYSGDTKIDSGTTLQIGNGGTTGDIGGIVSNNGAGGVTNDGTLVFNRSNGIVFNGVISGTGSVTQDGTGSVTLSSNNSYSGGTTVANGTLKIAGANNLGSGVLTLDKEAGATNATLVNTATITLTNDVAIGAGGGTFQTDENLTLNGGFSGTGNWEKAGSGNLVFGTGNSIDWTGTGDINQGEVIVNGTLGKAGATTPVQININQNAALSGSGTLNGNVGVKDGGSLAGSDGQTLTINGNLTFATNSSMNVVLGTSAASGTALFDVNGDVALAGTLNITQDMGGFGAGISTLIDYTGTATGTMAIASAPGNKDHMWVQNDTVDKQVNLVNQDGVELRFWDGDDRANHNNGTVDGGSGTWNASNDNWTEPSQSGPSFNGRWENDNKGYAVFNGIDADHPATVTIDNGDGQVRATGMQFQTSGYTVTGDPLVLYSPSSDAQPIIRVGDGQASGASKTATIDSELRGTDGLNKTDYGTAILTGDNRYTGGTTVSGGTLQLGNGGTTGSIIGDVNLTQGAAAPTGTLAFDHSQGANSNFSGNITGTGQVVQKGSDQLTLSGTNTFSGGMMVASGSILAGADGTVFGTGVLTLKDSTDADLGNHNVSTGGLAGTGSVALGSGTLTLTMGSNSSFSGIVSGSGGLTKTGSGTQTLSGVSTYSGITEVDGGTLQQGATGAFNTASSTYSVAAAGTLDINGFDTTLSGLSNAGMINMNNANAGTTLTVAGNYSGKGGTVVINTVLGDDSSQTDKFKITGDTSGNTNVKIVNRGGIGAQTTNGIDVVEVDGQSNGTFSLVSDYTTKDGKKAVVAGAYAYTLQQGGAKTPDDGNWYLASQFNGNTDPSGPADPRYGANVPVYEGYAQTMQALNKLPTLQERVGNRYWTGQNGDGRTNGAMMNARGIWGRVEGAHNRLESSTPAGMRQDINTFQMQAGVDGEFYESSMGRLIAGITGQYGAARSDMSSRDGDGNVSTQAWSLGATTTWYGDKGFYVDGQAQLTWFDNDLDSKTANSGLASGAKAFGYAVSFEAGKRIVIDDHWSLTPQAQLLWASINADAFQDVFQANVSLHDGNNLTGRLGLAVNYDKRWTGNDGRMINSQVYGLANIYQEFLGGTQIIVSGTRFDTNNDDTWAGIGAGGTYAWADGKYAVFGEGSINTSLSHFADSYTLKATAGIKVNW